MFKHCGKTRRVVCRAPGCARVGIVRGCTPATGTIIAIVSTNNGPMSRTGIRFGMCGCTRFCSMTAGHASSTNQISLATNGKSVLI